MPLIKDTDVVTLEHPREPGVWFKMRPIRTQDVRVATAGDVPEFEAAIALLKRVLVSWSYEDELTDDSVDLLDFDTVQWLCTEIKSVSGLRSEAEKNVSSSRSAPTLASVAGDSLTNSLT